MKRLKKSGRSENRNRSYFHLFIIALILIPCISHAKTETIFADHKYVMGDNDSKNDARRMCFLEAKRKVLEKAGTYIESHTQTKNFQLTKDEINSYSAVLLKVETVKEEWKMEGQNMAVFLTVKAEVDMDSINKQISKIKKDTSAQKKIREQQARLNQLERSVAELQKQLGTVGAVKAATLRKERNVVFKEIDKLEAKKLRIVKLIQSKSRDALRYVSQGMTYDDVKSLLGLPRSKADCVGDYYMNYGNIWIWCPDHVVKGYLTLDQWKGPCASGSYGRIYKRFK